MYVCIMLLIQSHDAIKYVVKYVEMFTFAMSVHNFAKDIVFFIS